MVFSLVIKVAAPNEFVFYVYVSTFKDIQKEKSTVIAPSKVCARTVEDICDIYMCKIQSFVYNELKRLCFMLFLVLLGQTICSLLSRCKIVCKLW